MNIEEQDNKIAEAMANGVKTLCDGMEEALKAGFTLEQFTDAFSKSVAVSRAEMYKEFCATHTQEEIAHYDFELKIWDQMVAQAREMK